MAFQGSVSDEEIEDYLHKNVGDFRPDWQSLYFDLIGMGEMSGLAQIAKKDAIKVLSTGIKGFLMDLPVESGMQELSKGLASTIRGILRGVRRAPQEFLDPVEKIFAKQATYAGPANAQKRVLGSFHIPKEEVKFGVEDIMTRATTDPGLPADVAYHEIGHALQKARGITAKDDSYIRELHMGLFGGELERAARAGKMSMDTVDEIFNKTYNYAHELAKDAPTVTPHDVIKRMSNRRANERQAMLFKRNTGAQSPFQEETLEETIKYLKLNALTPEQQVQKTLPDLLEKFKSSAGKEEFEQLIKELGGETFEKFPSQVDDLINTAKGINEQLTQKAYELGRDIHAGKIDRNMVEQAKKQMYDTATAEGDSMNIMRTQYFGEALELADILGGKPSSKIGWMKKMGILPADFTESNF